eukprot:525212-Hanusia_phi.AAC.6
MEVGIARSAAREGVACCRARESEEGVTRVEGVMSDPLETLSSTSVTFEDLSTEALTSPLARTDTLDSVTFLLIPSQGIRRIQQPDETDNHRQTSSFDPNANTEYRKFLNQEDSGVMLLKMSHVQFDMFVQEDVRRRTQRHDVKILTIRPPKLPMTPNFDHVIYSDSEDEGEDDFEIKEKASQLKLNVEPGVSHEHDKESQVDPAPQSTTSDKGSEDSSLTTSFAALNLTKIASEGLMSLNLSEMIEEESKRVLEKYKVRVKDAVFQDFDQEMMKAAVNAAKDELEMLIVYKVKKNDVSNDSSPVDGVLNRLRQSKRLELIRRGVDSRWPALQEELLQEAEHWISLKEAEEMENDFTDESGVFRIRYIDDID